MNLPKIDLLISPFDADVNDMVSLAVHAEDVGFDGIWTYDHLTGEMLGRGRSNDVFVVLSAIAARTSRVNVGPLVANMVNRHPVRLALAMKTLQELSDGRAILGLGSGPSPGSTFDREQSAIGIESRPAEQRRAALIETITLLRTLWSGQSTFDGTEFAVDNLDFHLGVEPAPAILIGASGAQTAKVALAHADGFNASNPAALEKLRPVMANAPADFEVSVHQQITFDTALDEQLDEDYSGLGRVILAVRPPFDESQLAQLLTQAGAACGRPQ